MALNVSALLEKVVSLDASDLHLVVGSPPVVRINTALSPLKDQPVLKTDDVEYVLSQILSQEQKDIFDVNKEIDFSLGLGNKARFRVNAFYQKGYPSVAMRLISMTVPSIEELNLPPVIGSFCNLAQGLVLVTGPTGHGKSTTLAAMIQRINETRAEHIITIEDPIEYVFQNKLSLIEQREMYLDTHSWDVALKSILRQDPNVVLLGEMRDTETMEAALRIAETGHLVFATLHTNSAAQTVERIMSSFPQEAQNEVRLQFSQVIEAIVSLRLVPSPARGVVPAMELLIANTAVRSLIREGKTYQIDNIISTSANLGMNSLEKSLAQLVLDGLIEPEEAMKHTNKIEDLRRYLKGVKGFGT